VLVLVDRKDGEPDHVGIVIGETHQIVYQTERITFNDCAQLLSPARAVRVRAGGSSVSWQSVLEDQTRELVLATVAEPDAAAVS
jgi:hypothetical protein